MVSQRSNAVVRCWHKDLDHVRRFSWKHVRAFGARFRAERHRTDITRSAQRMSSCATLQMQGQESISIVWDKPAR